MPLNSSTPGTATRSKPSFSERFNGWSQAWHQRYPKRPNLDEFIKGCIATALCATAFGFGLTTSNFHVRMTCAMAVILYLVTAIAIVCHKVNTDQSER